jgi:hypothetical protein
MTRHQKTPCDTEMGNWRETIRAEYMIHLLVLG